MGKGMKIIYELNGKGSEKYMQRKVHTITLMITLSYVLLTQNNCNREILP